MLTVKQERFVKEYLKSGNASDAYRKAYNTGNMKADTIKVKACELLSSGNVAVTVERLRAKVQDATVYTLAEHMNRLEELSRLAAEAGQFGPATKAEELRGKVTGFYVERVDHTHSEPVTITFTLDRPHADGLEGD
jgi:phage terminase small subunit